MKISASIYSWKKELPECVKAIQSAGVDYIHVDCKDEPTVFDDIKRIRNLCDLPIDLHIISNTPEYYYPLIEKNSIEFVSFQYENLPKNAHLPVNLDSRFGLAICTGTDISVFEDYQNYCSFLMFMTTKPGESGGGFNTDTFNEIRKFKSQYPSKAVHVDGGVNQEVGFILKSLGCSCAVTGSYLAESETAGIGALALKLNEAPAKHTVSDFMLRLNEVPVCSEEHLSVYNILNVMNKNKMGFAIIVDDNGKAKGVVSDGDIRRAMIEKIDSLENLDSNDLINTEYFSIKPEDTVDSVMKTFEEAIFPLLFLPVVREDHTLVGALSFNTLIRGDV